MSKRKHVIETTVWRLERVKNSVNGNPRYRVGTSDGDFLTSSDHSFVYQINNGWGDKRSRPANLYLTRNGRIYDLAYTDTEE